MFGLGVVFWFLSFVGWGRFGLRGISPAKAMFADLWLGFLAICSQPIDLRIMAQIQLLGWVEPSSCPHVSGSEGPIKAPQNHPESDVSHKCAQGRLKTVVQAEKSRRFQKTGHRGAVLFSCHSPVD